VFSVRKGYYSPIRRAKNLIRPKGRKSTKLLKLRPIENFWADLIRKVYRHNYRPKDVKCLMGKIRKELKSIKTKGARKAMKKACSF
jgi:hypothetical protein